MMTVTTIWRYPVKSMAGERLQSTELTVTRLVGDRLLKASKPAFGHLQSVMGFARHLSLVQVLVLFPLGVALHVAEEWPGVPR
jgi:uncharacterized protein YcbX